jgi:Domain of unknown function (DUF4283)
MEHHGKWQLVSRRRRNRPPNTYHPSETRPEPITTTPYLPYGNLRTYAQVAAHMPLNNPANPNILTSATPTNPSPPSTPPDTPPGTKYYFSPHSPTNLRFPPSPRFPEWHGRCFRCCRQGHLMAVCRNPAKCGKCWKEGHTGNHCQSRKLNPMAPAFVPNPRPTSPQTSEPNFDELFHGTYHYPQPQMPENRRKSITCFIDRTDEYFKEVARLNRAVVLDVGEWDVDLTPDEVAAYAAKTNLVRPEELQIAIITMGRYLIILPEGLSTDTFIKAMPLHCWKIGLSYRPWSQLEDSTIIMTRFKVWIDLIGLPLNLWSEKVVRMAVSQMGVYLGTINPKRSADLSFWSVVVATPDLETIPEELKLVIGGLEYKVRVSVNKWVHTPLYTAADFPKQPLRYSPPFSNDSSASSSSKGSGGDDFDSIPIPRKTLIEIVGNRDLSSLPPEIKQFIHGQTPHAVQQSAPQPPEPKKMATKSGITQKVATTWQPVQRNTQGAVTSNTVVHYPQPNVATDNPTLETKTIPSLKRQAADLQGRDITTQSRTRESVERSAEKEVVEDTSFGENEVQHRHRKK